MIKLFAGACALLLSLSLSFSFSAVAADDLKTFTFTAIPDQDETQLKLRFDQVADYLSKELGVDVNYVPVKSYSAAVAAFRNNQVQLAWFGGLSGVQARRLVPGSQAIAQGFEDPSFKSYIIANSKTGLKAADTLPAAVADKTFTFGSKGSTSGRLMPEFFLREHYAKLPADTFKRVGFSGDHSRTIALVQSGAYDLGAVNYKVWERALAEGKVDPSKVAVIWTTPGYPDYQWTLRAELDAGFGEGFSANVQQALLGMKDENLLQAFPRASFIPATNADYDTIEKVGESIGLLDAN
jgi:phosphonate transport system substrate-binding protein